MNEPMFSRDIDASGTARRRFVPCPVAAAAPAASAASDSAPVPATPGWRSMLAEALGLGPAVGLGETV